MSIVVWRGLIVDYMLITGLIGNGEVIRQANKDEIKRYWANR